MMLDICINSKKLLDQRTVKCSSIKDKKFLNECGKEFKLNYNKEVFETLLNH